MMQKRRRLHMLAPASDLPPSRQGGCIFLAPASDLPALSVEAPTQAVAFFLLELPTFRRRAWSHGRRRLQLFVSTIGTFLTAADSHVHHEMFLNVFFIVLAASNVDHEIFLKHCTFIWPNDWCVTRRCFGRCDKQAGRPNHTRRGKVWAVMQPHGVGHLAQSASATVHQLGADWVRLRRAGRTGAERLLKTLNPKP